jgi:hypothetical protein
VIFEAPALIAMHHGDRETQAIFHSEDIVTKPSDMILIVEERNGWTPYRGKWGKFFEGKSMEEQPDPFKDVKEAINFSIRLAF